MPRDTEKRRAQQRELMRTRRAKTANPTNESSEATGVDLGGEHYWGAVSKAPEGKRICTAFEFYGPGQWIGGCGEIRDWPFESEPTVAEAIIDSPYFREIQGKMPVMPGRR